MNSLKGNFNPQNETSTDLIQLSEDRLQILHNVIPHVLCYPDIAPKYMAFLRKEREKTHLIGKRNIKLMEHSDGIKFFVDVGDRLGCDFYYGFIHEAFDSHLFLELIQPGNIVIDAGANFGYYTIMGGKKLGSKGRVYSFEPDTAAHELLTKNIELNKLDDIVTTYPFCLGDINGDINFNFSEESPFSGIADTGRSKIRKIDKVPIRSVDSLFKELNIPSVDAIKIDVEGFEYMVLNGAIETLKNSKSPIIMIEVSKKNLNSDRIQKLGESLSKLYSIGMKGWFLDELDCILRIYDKDIDISSNRDGNIIFVKSGSPAEIKLKKIGQTISQNINILAKEKNLFLKQAATLDFFTCEAVFQSIKNYEYVISELKDLYDKTEEERLANLELLKKKVSSLTSIRELYVKTEAERIKILKLANGYENKISQLMDDIHEKDERLKAVELENQGLKEEVKKSITSQIIKKFKNFWMAKVSKN